MKDSILGLLQTVRLIHSVSQFYNTSERTSALMVKVSLNYYVSVKGRLHKVATKRFNSLL